MGAKNFIGWKIHMMTSYLLLAFLTNEIQTLQHQSKKCETHQGDFDEK